MNSLNIVQDVKNAEKRVPLPEYRLGKELLMPFAASSSGARKLMFATHQDHCMALMHPEMALISTGFESEFGKRSSTFTVADYDAEVVAKIPKFMNSPESNYYLIILKDNGELDVINRISYNPITETYGYLFNTAYLDARRVGDTIKRSDVIQKSTSFDDFNNKMDGINLLTTYMACNYNTEDAIILAESAAKKLNSPLIKRISIVVNDNDILLNLYGDDNYYKVLPDINEYISNGILAAIRRENKDEAFYAQSYERLKDIIMSDDVYIANGKVIDIDVYCNNPENLTDNIYNEQLKYYWDNRLRMCADIVNSVDKIKENGYKLSYDLSILYSDCLKTLEGKKFNKTKPFSNIGIDLVVLEELELKKGDKISNRYGGKGVVGTIVKDELMPRLPDGRVIECIYNQASGTNRLNLSQFFEYEINFFGTELCNWLSSGPIDDGIFDVSDSVKAIIDFIRIVNPEQADYWENLISTLSDEELITFIDTVTTDKGIMLSLMPVTNNATFHTIEKLMDRFPFIKQIKPYVPITSSDGSIRYIQTVRPIIAGYEYIYRLKQYAEEKFSTTSLSSINLRGENSRSKAASMFKDVHTKTPVRFGDMETMAAAHVGVDAVVFMLMLNATSPSARRRVEELLTNDTIDVDVKLGEDDSSRIVETLNAYLKTMGLRLVFEKKPKTFPVFLHKLFTKAKPLQELFYKSQWKQSDDDFYNSVDGSPDIIYTRVKSQDYKKPDKLVRKIYTREVDYDNDINFNNTWNNDIDVIKSEKKENK